MDAEQDKQAKKKQKERRAKLAKQQQRAERGDAVEAPEGVDLSRQERRELERSKKHEARAKQERTKRRRERVGSKERMRQAWRESGEIQPLPDVPALLAQVDAETAGQPQRPLEEYAFHILSQHGEDGITYELFKRAGIVTRTCVEFGCGHNGGNAGFLAAGLGFGGLLVDGDEDYIGILKKTFADLDIAVESHWLTRESAPQLLASHGIDGEIDYLGIDLDGNDWWIWDSLEAIKPRVVVVEYNSLFGPDEAVTVQYESEFDRGTREDGDFRRPKGYFGGSLLAFERLARRRGYRLVASAPESENAFFVRDDLAPETPTRTVAEVYREPRKDRHALRRQEIADAGGPTAWGKANGAELVEIGENGLPG